MSCELPCVATDVGDSALLDRRLRTTRPATRSRGGRANLDGSHRARRGRAKAVGRCCTRPHRRTLLTTAHRCGVRSAVYGSGRTRSPRRVVTTWRKSSAKRCLVLWYTSHRAAAKAGERAMNQRRSRGSARRYWGRPSGCLRLDAGTMTMRRGKQREPTKAARVRAAARRGARLVATADPVVLRGARSRVVWGTAAQLRVALPRQAEQARPAPRQATVVPRQAVTRQATVVAPRAEPLATASR